MVDNYIKKHITSSILIQASTDTIWNNITDVKIERFSEPWYFKFLNIPKPIKAEIQTEGAGGKRIAYFRNHKKFIQKIVIWDKPKQYSFSFQPETGFKVGYIFDLSEGLFKILTGSYYLLQKSDGVILTLETTYSIHKKVYPIFNLPIRLVLKLFQNYLLTSIKINSEN